MSDHSNSPNLDEAATWFAARRRGVMSIEERRAYEAWIGESTNAASIAELEETWELLSSAQPQFAGATIVARASRRARANPALVAAMCVLSIGIGILSYSGDNRFWTTLDWTQR